MYLLSIICVSVAAAMPFLPTAPWGHVSDIGFPLFDAQPVGGSNVTQTNGSYCGEDLVQLNKVIAVQLSATFDQLQNLRVAFNTSSLDQMDHLTELNELVVSMARNLALINWSCVSIDLSIQIAAVMNDLLVQMEYFLLAVLHHLMEGNKLDQESSLVFGIPTVITHSLEQISGVVVVFRLTVWREILNVHMLISMVSKQAGATSG